MGQTRIELSDITKVPAISGNMPGPFKNIRYEVSSDGGIKLTIIKELDLLTYDVNFAKKLSSLRRVQIRIYEMFGTKEYLIRTLNANFISYVLDERPMPGGNILREEIISWEVTDIL